jgi:glyoxylate reductase
VVTANPTGTDSRPGVLLTRRIPASVQSKLEAGCNVELVELDKLDRGASPLTADELVRRLQGKQGLVCVLTDPVNADVLRAAPDLKVVANIAVGYDNIDVAAAQSRGIVVTNTPDVLTESVAELTWALILAVTRRIGEGERLVRRGGWKGWALDFMLGMELGGKQLGIIGRGRIGRAVAARASAFGMTAVFAARDSRSSSDLPELSIDELLVSSDVVSIHTPLTPTTRHLIDRRALARMKRSAFLVNTARGPVVDEEALAWALKEHLIAGAALDVYEREPEVFRGLLDLENVVLAPHLGSATRETRTAMAAMAVSNVLAVLQGRPALTPVSPR